MNQLKLLLTGLLSIMASAVLAQSEPKILDITKNFTYTWGWNESFTTNADGSITYKASTWGGLASWVDDDWSDYERIVFEFKEPTACDVQPLVGYGDAPDWGRGWGNKGTKEVSAELDPDYSDHVTQVALQTASDATVIIARIYLVVGQSSPEEVVDDTIEPDEEQDAKLMINELMQSNIDGVMDDLREFPDSWVELYNGGTTAARLNRYRLGRTDDPNEAWPLPNRKVKADGHILVYCDKAADSLHTDFRLESGKGGEIYLFRDGLLIDKVTELAKQPSPNIAYGRQTDGSSTWGYQLTATPKAPNSGEICDRDHILGDPVFSEKGRVVNGAHPLTLELSVPAGSPAGTEIRYTTDGTEPTMQSNQYNGAISISSNKVIRARLFCKGWLSPYAVTESYLFHPRKVSLPVVSIVTRDEYLNDKKIGIFANNKNNARKINWRRPINIEFFFGEGTESVVNQLCETRVSGGATREAAKKSMALYANKRFGNKRFDYEFFPADKPGQTDFKSLLLRNAGNDFDYLYMRDAIVQRSMATHVDLDWQAWQPAIVYINGSYHGMLNIRERGNESNVYTNYNGLEDIDLIENWNDLKEGTWDNLNQFKAFYNEAGHTLAEYEEWMDCEEFTNLMVMNLYYNNFDFPGNNIIMWRPRAEGGRWRWIVKDTDYTMGLYGDPVNYNILKWLYNENYDSGKRWGANGSKATLLFRRLMEDEDYHRMFIDRACIYMGDFLNEKGINAVWDPMRDLIKDEYPSHRKLINEWWPNYDDEVNNAKKWIRQRNDIFYKQLGDYYQLGAPIALTINKDTEDADAAGITFNGVTLSEGAFDGKFFKDRQLTLEGNDAGEKVVTGWHVVQTTNGSTETKDVSGPLLSMTMPSCSSLLITAMIADGSTGITTIREATHATDVYDLNGRKVRSGTTSLEGLPKGVYIIGGRKVIK